jgi:hypothetical protein
MFQLQYGGGRFQELFYYLEYWGLSEVILPFILIFTIIYAVLQKVQLFAEPKFNGVIALAISLITVIPHVLGKYPAGMDIITIINTSLPQTALLIVAVLMVLVLTGLVWGDETKTSAFAGFVALLAAAILVVIFVSSIVPTPVSWIISQIDPALQTLIIGILVFGLVFYYVVKGGKTGTTTSEGFVKGAQKFFKEIFQK